MCCSPPDPPDTTPMAEANKEIAEKQFALQQQQFDWFKENSQRGMEIGENIAQEAIAQGRWSREQQIEAAEITREIRERDRVFEAKARGTADETRGFMVADRAKADELRAIAGTERGEADKLRGEATKDRSAGQALRDRYDQKFAPLEGQYLQQVQSLLDPAAREMAAAKAGSQVAAAFKANEANATAKLRALGVDPSMGRSVNDKTMAVAQAAATAQEMNDARQQADARGMAALGGAIDMGREYWGAAQGLEQQSQGLRGQALAQGAQALNTGQQAISQNAQALGYGQQALGYEGAAMGYGNRALGMGAQTQDWGSQAMAANQGAGQAYNAASSTAANTTNSAAQWGNSAVGANASAAGILNDYGQAQQAAHQTPIMDLAGGLAGIAVGKMVGSADGGQIEEGSLKTFETGTTQVRQPVPSTAFAMDTGAGGVYGVQPGGAIPLPATNVLRAPDGGMAMGPGNGSGIDDRIPAAVSSGEYIIPADVVKKKGTDFFDKLVEKMHTPAAVQQAMAAQSGAMAMPTAVAPMGQAPMGPAMPQQGQAALRVGGMAAPALT